MVAARKVESLLYCGARIIVVSPDAVETIQRLAESDRINWLRRPYLKGDLDGVFLAVAATDKPEVQQQIAGDAASLPVLLNCVDNPSVCDFQVPSQLRRGELLITISTGGASPAFSRQIRERLEAEFGPEYGPVVDLLSRLRVLVVGADGGPETNAALFRHILTLDLAEMVRKGAWDNVLVQLRNILPAHIDPTAAVSEWRQSWAG
jgi:precorrin-2 dehydrogenase/sirohydrochlorin ferrochelatase